jgi:hypothetical protein
MLDFGKAQMLYPKLFSSWDSFELIIMNRMKEHQDKSSCASIKVSQSIFYLLIWIANLFVKLRIPAKKSTEGGNIRKSIFIIDSLLIIKSLSFQYFFTVKSPYS